MNVKRIVALSCALVIAAVALVWLAKPPQIRPYGKCSICLRPIHAGMAALSRSKEDGWKTTCCIACVFANSRQTGHLATLEQVTDYPTGEHFGPERATYVVGGDRHVCMHQEMVMDQTKTPMPIHFDRCEPPIMAFRNPADAAAFNREHGGIIRNWNQLVRQFEAAPRKEAKP
jgi:hypothetical protein